MSTLPVIEFGGMSYIRWNGFYICCDQECPANKGKPHVWVAKRLPRACGKCKRITWNRKDERFTAGRPKGKTKGQKPDAPKKRKEK